MMTDNGSVGPTKGPWTVDPENAVLVRDADGNLIADCDVCQYTDDGEVQLEDCPANARLIATAPELATGGHKLNALVEQMQAAVTEFLTPDSNATNGDLIDKLIYLLDGPEQREAQGELRAALQKAGLSAGEGC